MPSPIRNARTTSPSFDPPTAGDASRATPPQTAAAAPTRRTALSQLAGLPSRPRSQPPQLDLATSPRGGHTANEGLDAHRHPPQANPATNRPRGRLAGNLQLDNGNPLITSLNVPLGEVAEADVAASYAGLLRLPSISLDGPPTRRPAATPFAGLEHRTRARPLAQEPSGLGSVRPPFAFPPDSGAAALAGHRLRDYLAMPPPDAIASALNNLSRFPDSALDPYRGSAQPATQVLEDWAARCRLPSETVAAWRPVLNQEESRPFVSLLARLDGCASFKPAHRAESLKELGSILQLAAHNDAYRARCFDICGGADANCHDNVDVIFGNLRLAARDPSYHGNAQLHEVLGHHNDCMPWTLIDDFVSQRFGRGDQLERVLALRIRLSDILPITTPAMLYSGVAGITDAHEREARAYIKDRLGTPENLLRNLSRSPAWRQFLERQRPVEFAANTLLWESALQDVMAKPAGDGAMAEAPRAGSTAAPASRTEALAQARAMPGLGTGQAFQHRQENATVMLAETMTRQLVTESAPPPDETGAHAALLTDPDWRAYLQKEHPEDPAFSSADMDAGERHDQLMQLTRQEINEARGMTPSPAGAPTDHG
ncbi:NEL domain-containing protein [Ralstonia pseudosolanacearum]|uniref:NEL domain-containing protein n=1 Tax=Ralstonia pseudosolanacearum TaxID=1310165 RepID=UPI001E3D5DFB|nr:NEL domain-containing protein [Ralstonia pseudosolanacearum]